MRNELSLKALGYGLLWHVYAATILFAIHCFDILRGLRRAGVLADVGPTATRLFDSFPVRWISEFEEAANFEQAANRFYQCEEAASYSIDCKLYKKPSERIKHGAKRSPRIGSVQHRNHYSHVLQNG